MGCSQSSVEVGIATVRTHVRASRLQIPPQLGAPVKPRPAEEQTEDFFDRMVDKTFNVWCSDDSVAEASLGLEGRDNIHVSKVDHPVAGQLLIPSGVTCTYLNTMKLEFGLVDERTKIFKADVGAKASVNFHNGEINKTAMASIKKMLTKGKGICHWRVTLQLLDMKVGSTVPKLAFNWIKGVTLGAEILGEMEVEHDDDAELDLDGSGEAMLNAESLGARVGLKYSSLDPGEILNGHIEQLGGVPISAMKYARSPLLDVLKFVDQIWVPLTKKSPRTWQTIRVDVNEKLNNKEEAIKAAENRAHLVVTGCIGAGKSTFLNAVGGFKKCALRKDLFLASNSPAAVTARVESKKVCYDRFKTKAYYTLTDVPGFDDPNRENSKTCSELLQTLQRPELSAVHGLVLVVNLSERFKDSLLKPLQMIERKFGENMWDHFVVVLTHLNGEMKPTSETYTSAQKWLREELPVKRREWVESLQDQFPGAKHRWVNQQNMVFTIDSAHLKKDVVEFVELVPTDDLQHQRKVGEDHKGLFPPSVFEKNKQRQSELDMQLQWKDTPMSALYEHSLEQIEALRECIALKVQQKNYMAMNCAVHSEEVCAEANCPSGQAPHPAVKRHPSTENLEKLGKVIVEPDAEPAHDVYDEANCPPGQETHPAVKNTSFIEKWANVREPEELVPPLERSSQSLHLPEESNPDSCSFSCKPFWR